MNQTINISLPKKLAQLAQKQVEAGYYTSVSEVIRDALRNTFAKPKQKLDFDNLPTFPMSEELEEIGLQAIKDFKAGETHSLENIEDLADL